MKWHQYPLLQAASCHGTVGAGSDLQSVASTSTTVLLVGRHRLSAQREGPQKLVALLLQLEVDQRQLVGVRFDCQCPGFVDNVVGEVIYVGARIDV